MKVVGLVGAYHCGSTIISRYLSSLPDVCAPGEIGRIFTDGWPICQCCAENCPVYTKELISGLTKENVYDVLGGRLGASTVVSSDKNMGSLLSYKMKPSVVILLTRDPVQHTVSVSGGYGSEMFAATQLVLFYNEQIALIRKEKLPMVHVRMEAFLRDPQAAVSWLAARGIVPEGSPELVQDYHSCLGNYEGATSLHVNEQRMHRHSPREDPHELERVLKPLAQCIQSLNVPHFD